MCDSVGDLNLKPAAIAAFLLPRGTYDHFTPYVRGVRILRPRRGQGLHRRREPGSGRRAADQHPRRADRRGIPARHQRHRRRGPADPGNVDHAAARRAQRPGDRRPRRPHQRPGPLRDRLTVRSGLAASQVQERAHDAPNGSQLIGCHNAKAAPEALMGHRAQVFGPGEGGQLAQARCLRSDRDLMAQAPIPARYRHHEDHTVRQREVQRAGDDDDWPAAALFRGDDRVQVGQPDIAGAERLTHSSPSPSAVV